jgi:PAS domain S-box-containing protein
MGPSVTEEKTVRKSLFSLPLLSLLPWTLLLVDLHPGHAAAQAPAPLFQRLVMGHDHPLFPFLLVLLLAALTAIPLFFWLLRRQVRKRTAELMVSQERYRHMVQNAGDILFLADEEGRLRYINPIAEVILGYKAEEMTGKPYWEFVLPDFRKEVIAFYFNQREAKTLSTYRELPLLRKDSQIVWLGQNTQLLEDGGKVIGFQAIARDISERKRVEQELAVTRQRLTRAEIISRSGNWEFDLKSKLVFASEGARRLYGLHETEWTIPDVQKIPLPGYREPLNEALRGLIEEGRPYDVEFRIRRPDSGEIIDIHSVAEYDSSRKVAFGIIQDITDRKRAEADLRENRRFLSELIEYSGALIFVKDRQGRYEMVNRKWEAVSSLTRGEVLGKTDLELFPGSNGEQFRQNDLAVMEAGAAREAEEILDDPRLGRRFFISVKFPILDDGGRVRGLCGMTTEITERKRAEEERKSLQERLQRAEKMEALGALAGGVAHDLNNVLGILIGYSELLLNDLPPESRLRRHAEKIMDGGARAAAIVQDLLTLARRGGHSEEIVNLNAVVEALWKTAEFDHLRFNHPRIEIRTDLAPDLLSITGSRAHLLKTLSNLLTNAAEAMPNGGVVTVATCNRSLDLPLPGYDDVRQGDYAVLSVGDTGGGITAEDMKHIFEPFYTKKVMGRSGTGLGLAVVWGTVKDHHGTIDVKSEPGKGSTFTLYFPVDRQLPVDTPEAPPQAQTAGKSESILVVDDVPEQRELAADMLSGLNYHVETAASGEEAVETLKKRPFDLIVLDMIMAPGMDGLDTFREPRRIRPGQKTIIVSGFAETDRVQQTQALGAGDYLRKPYVREKLALAVRKELNRK